MREAETRPRRWPTRTSPNWTTQWGSARNGKIKWLERQWQSKRLAVQAWSRVCHQLRCSCSIKMLLLKKIRMCRHSWSADQNWTQNTQLLKPRRPRNKLRTSKREQSLLFINHSHWRHLRRLVNRFRSTWSTLRAWARYRNCATLMKTAKIDHLAQSSKKVPLISWNVKLWAPLVGKPMKQANSKSLLKSVMALKFREIHVIELSCRSRHSTLFWILRFQRMLSINSKTRRLARLLAWASGTSLAARQNWESAL